MKKLIHLVFLVTILLFACEKSKEKEKKAKPEQKLKVFAVNYPLYYFAERIGGDYIALTYPIPDDVDPAYWEPKQELAEIQSVDLILANGADYAKWMDKVSLPSSKIVNTSQAFADEYIEIQEGTTHSHGGAGEHVHYGYAFTTWLDFEIAIGQAETIKNAFVEKLPDHKSDLSANFEALKSELIALDKSMKIIGDRLKGQTLFGSHPVYQYLGRSYGLEIISEHWEPGEMPDDKQWSDFKHNVDHHPADFMLWEGEPRQEIKEKLDHLGITTVVFDPCANKPKTSNFIDVMTENINNMKRISSMPVN